MAYLSTIRPGVSFSLSDLSTVISNAAGSGVNATGDISAFLMNLGLSVSDAQTALANISANFQGDPAALKAIQDTQYTLAVQPAPTKNTWLVPVLIGAGVLWYLSRNRK